MKIVADLHLHSKYSRATSKNMDLEGLSTGARLKGLQLLGTGDFTFPDWLQELKEKLEPVDNSGLFKFNGVYWILTTEVSTIYQVNNVTKKSHHIIHVSSFEEAEQINESLSKYGKLQSDGRPTLLMTAPELVEKVIGISKNAIITSAHIWTPWFSIFGSKSGFDSIDDAYQDQIKHIFSLETGLSSDPAMNWRLSQLDRFTLVSNSDSHSPNPWRLGREANVFDFKNITFKELYDTLKKKDNSKFLFTIETDPNYGKYHFDGHKDCQIILSPEQSKKTGGICPRCGKKLTIGVLNRLEQLADRPEGYVPKNAIPFRTLLPLYEIISYSTGAASLYSKKVLLENDKLIAAFENELNILLNVPRNELLKVTSDKIADAIIKVRDGRMNYIPGYDGEYGKPVFDDNEYAELKKQMEKRMAAQKSLRDFKK
jgi:uncharacterized protein (TIGR00375 family)